MRVPVVKCAVALALGSLLLLGANGCAPSQVTHHSGQIGRYYGDGVSFSVPVVQIADEVQKEDKFWEVRQGIGGADVVVLGPFVREGEESYRETLALSSRPVSGVSNTEQVRDALLKSIAEEVPSAAGFAKGQDDGVFWADYTCTENNKELFCRAYFFFDGERSLGYALVGTVLNSAKNDNILRDFADIAETFRIGVPQSGFVCLSDSLVGAVNLVAVSASTASEPTAPANQAVSPAGDSPTPATTPANQAITPANPATTPANPATTPANPATTPADSATTPADSATTPADSATTPADSATTPADSATPIENPASASGGN